MRPSAPVRRTPVRPVLLPVCAVAAALACLAGRPLHAQFGTPASTSRIGFGIGLGVAQPVHDFRLNVGNGWGGSGHAAWKLDRLGILALRVDGGILNYGRETRDAFVGGGFGRRNLGLRTTNNVFWGAIGPQLTVPVGPVRPYVNAQVGGALFSTSTTLFERRRFDSDRDLDSWTEQSDGTWAWGGGGGLLLRVSRAMHLDLGARYHRNGRVNYLLARDLREAEDGNVVLAPRRSAADFWTYQIGLAFAW